MARLNDHGAFGWISLLRARAELSIPKQESETFLGELLRLGRQPRLELPDELQFEQVAPRRNRVWSSSPDERHPLRHPRLLGQTVL